ncbi:MAG TPA: hypothetical protein VMF05_08625 [Stellaceae bacterium]|nr:hypothetical protein [Stellaceae bacterium]
MAEPGRISLLVSAGAPGRHSHSRCLAPIEAAVPRTERGRVHCRADGRSAATGAAPHGLDRHHASPHYFEANIVGLVMKKKFDVFLPIAIVLAIAAAAIGVAHAQSFTACKGTFALCTIAPCDPIPGNNKEVACHCTVNNGYSAGQKACQPVKQTAAGEEIRSRYYPVKSYAVCSNDRSWAWCLDKTCIIDKNNPRAATCRCDAVSNLGRYVIVTSAYTPATCTTGVISSATVQQITQVTDFLKTKSKSLPPFPIRVLNESK